MDDIQRYKENEKLVYYVFKKSFPNLSTDEDMIQEAKIGLWKACITFREEMGYNFSSYACKVIFNTILSVIKKNSKCIENRPDTAIVSIHQPANPDEPDVFLGEYILGYDDDAFKSVEYKDAIKRVLTSKELDICKMIAQGMTQREVADIYGVSKQYISFQIGKIRKKLELSGIKS